MNWTRGDFFPINAHHVTDSGPTLSLVPRLGLKKSGPGNEGIPELSTPSFCRLRELGGVEA